jgi:Tfp pilus assembly protein PilX
MNTTLRLWTALRRERGQALPLVLGMMMILSISIGTVVFLSTSSENSSKRVNADQKAMDIAEAGLNDAVSVLANSTDPSVAAALPAASGSINGGSYAYTASLSGLTWTITSVGGVSSPIASGGLVQRTISTKYLVTPTGTPWEYAFADQPSGCMTIRNNASFTTPLYIKGNLCLSNNASYTAQKLYVGGTLTNSGSVGSAGTPISSATIVGGCTGGIPNPHPCTSADNVFATSISQTANTLTKPSVNLASNYANAKPGPSNACTVGSVPGGFDTNGSLDRSRAQFDLMPNSNYSCRYVDGFGNTVGELTWNKGTSTLTVAGIIFFDGDLYANGTATYSGRATIYSSGKVTFANNAKICGISGCTSAWDTSNNVLMLVAGSSTDANGFLLSNGAVFQGAAYTVNDTYIDNNATLWGPLVSRSIYVDNNADQNKALVRLPPGAPGIDQTVQAVSSSWRG